MDERQFLINLVFKPKVLNTQLYPGEVQLLLAYVGEILQEIEAAEVADAAKEKENA